MIFIATSDYKSGKPPKPYKLVSKQMLFDNPFWIYHSKIPEGVMNQVYFYGGYISKDVYCVYDKLHDQYAHAEVGL